MTNIEARAIQNARNELRRAQKELDRAQLHETRYRGVPTINVGVPSDVHGVFIYRGIKYTK